MRSRTFQTILPLILMTVAALVSGIHSVKSEPQTITVPDDYPTIQEALNQANDGDIVYVKKGTYLENLIVRKTITLLGENKDETIIDGQGLGSSISATADNVVISGFTIRDGNPEAICLLNRRNVTVTDNILIQNYMGVTITNGQNNTVKSNTMIGHTVCVMIAGYPGEFNTISSNVFANSSFGIDIHTVGGPNIIRDNYITFSNETGMWLNDARKTIIYRNCIANCSFYSILLEGAPETTVLENDIVGNNYNGIMIVSSANCSVYHNNFFNNTPAQAYVIDSMVKWDNTREGNYWSDYRGADANGDRIGDTPYNIEMNNQDRLPLIKPWMASHCDINKDDKIDIKDIALVAKAFGSSPSHPRWYPGADITGSVYSVPDGKVDIRDLALIASYYGKI